MQAGAGGEQVPQHELHVVQEEGQQKLQLSVKLPGLSSQLDIQLVCSSSSIGLTVPGRYALLLPLDVTISDAADSVKFMKKKQTLVAKFTIINEDAATSAAAGSGPGTATGAANGSGSSSSGTGQQQQQRGGDGAQRAAAVAAEEAARREQQRRLTLRQQRSG
ncbi:hypothetical protein COO60DRAFT_52905 [Scenedesmus sp. NREL 46B-D3]|nr:hypothetical protein COO60DRAFT_52905 [Scenedesmus sp. NREL 46B-D3]